jgi:protein-L-isoaspartate(D-aspartate) O-methyltransferase
MTDVIRAHQEHLLEAVWSSLGGRSPLDRVREAFFAVPRHLFVERYCTQANPKMREVSFDDLGPHLPAIYANGGLGIHYEPGDPRVATISAPWIVLEMLELLDLRPGQRVFELGTGSGWNAALMGHLVGPSGSVATVEILPGLVESARRGLARAGIENVQVTLGDGSLGPSAGELDRAVFTAGASDIPAGLFTRVRDGGRLLFVLAIPGGGNVLILFERRGAVFESLASRRCAFVPVTGAGSAAALLDEPLEIDAALIERLPFPLSAEERATDLRSYLWLAEPGFKCFTDGFGVRLPDSLALIRDGHLEIFGTRESGLRLQTHLRAWADLGFPGIADLQVTAALADKNPPGPGWSLRRPQTAFSFRPGSG